MLYLINITKCCGKTCYQVWEDVVNVDTWMMENNYRTSEDDKWWLDCDGNRVCEVGCNEGAIDLDGSYDVLWFVQSEDANAEELEVICTNCSFDAALEALRDSEYLDWEIFDKCVRILLKKSRAWIEQRLISELLPIAERLGEVEALRENVLEIKCHGDREDYDVIYGEILGELE